MALSFQALRLMAAISKFLLYLEAQHLTDNVMMAAIKVVVPSVHVI